MPGRGLFFGRFLGVLRKHRGYLNPKGCAQSAETGSVETLGRTMHRPGSAFTLVEILIVVIILGVLAAIVIPNLTGVTAISREANLKENLSKIRAQIQMYRNQHNGFPAAAGFAEQMTKYTRTDGQVSAVRTSEYRFGPYLEQMPPNPITSDRTIRAAAVADDTFPPGDADRGWWYNETTGAFFADLKDTHVDQEGNRYNRY